MKKASSGRNLYANLEIMPIWKCYPFFIRSSSTYAKIQESLGRIPPKIQKKTHFSLVSLSIYQRLRRGAERIRQGERRWSRLPKKALEGSYLTENSSSESRILRPSRKKTPDRIPPQKNDQIYSASSVSGVCGILFVVFKQAVALTYTTWLDVKERDTTH